MVKREYVDSGELCVGVDVSGWCMRVVLQAAHVLPAMLESKC